MYLKYSHPSRDLPMPAIPITDSRWAFRLSTVPWKISLTKRSSRSRPTKGASSPADFIVPRTPATTRKARHRGTGSAFPLRSWTPAGSYMIAASVERRVDSPTRTVPGSASACTRDAVLTRSPATIPWPSAPSVTAASPVSTPMRGFNRPEPTVSPRVRTACTSSIAARTARSASSSWATGVPHTAMTASPMNFSTVPPYRAMSRRHVSKYADSNSRTSSGSRASLSVVNPTRSANSTETSRRSDDAAARPFGRAAATPAGSTALPSAVPHSPQNRSDGSFGAPQDGHTTASGDPHDEQNFLPSRFTVPQFPQVTPCPPPPLGQGTGPLQRSTTVTWFRGGEAPRRDELSPHWSLGGGRGAKPPDVTSSARTGLWGAVGGRSPPTSVSGRCGR